jgi:hypothetical protein
MIRKVQYQGSDLYFIADEQGEPLSYGYRSQSQAKMVAEIMGNNAIEGLATLPYGIDVKEAKSKGEIEE